MAKTTYGVNFYKGKYGVGAASRKLPSDNKGIIFNQDEHVIYVDGVSYGTATDVTFENGILTITYADGRETKTLDFTDTASATATLNVFKRLNKVIGKNIVDGDSDLDYEGTNYISGEETLVNADRKLDSEIKNVNDKIEAMDASDIDTVTLTAATETTGAKLTFNNLNQTDGKIAEGTQTGEIQFAKIATTGDSADASIDTYTYKSNEGASDGNNVTVTLSETNAEAQIHELAKVVADDLTNVYDEMDANLVLAEEYTDNEIKKLDAEVESTDGTNVQVKVTEVDGKVTAVNVTDNTDEAIKTAIEKLDNAGETLASVTDGVVTLHKTITETDGIIDIEDSDSNEITLAKVATTGKAADTSYDDTTSKMSTDTVTVDNVQTAIEVLDSRLDDIETVDTFDTVVSKDAATTPAGATWTSGSETVTGTLVASADTMHKIYLVPDTSTTAEHSGTYNEYISIRQGEGESATYSWELIGNTKADLTGYVKTIKINGKEYAVAENSTEVTLGDAITKITGETAITGGDENYIAVTATTADASDGEKETTLSSTLKIQAVADASDSAKGLAEASDVKNYVDGKFDDLDAELDASDSYVEVSLKQTDGKINTLGVDVDYASISTSKTGDADTEMTSTDGIVIGSDVTKIAGFVNTRISEEIAKLDADKTSDDAAVATVEVKEEDGKISDVIVTTIGADVKFTTDESDNEPHLEVTKSTGAVLGSDVEAIKSYIDAKASASSTEVKNTNGDADALTVNKTYDADGHTIYDVNLVWSEFSEEA